MALSAPAQALCLYDGKHFEKSDDYAQRQKEAQAKSQRERDFDARMYAKTTLKDEFTDAALVLRGQVVSRRDMPASAKELKKDPDADDWVVYRIQVVNIFKGKAGREIQEYEENNSGRFGPEVGKEYLLFLNPMGRDDPGLGVAPGGFRINYSCGQSKPWRELSAADRQALDILAAGRK